MYRISYTLASSDMRDDIESQVVKRYNFLIKNIGTNFSCFMEEDDYNNAADFEKTLIALKDFYISLFYDNKIQAFSYNYQNNGTIGGIAENEYGYYEFNGFKVYDPYLIEFIIRNNILDGATSYIYVQHQYIMPTTFPIDYSRTIFFSLEECNTQTHIGTYVGQLFKAVQRLSLLYQYPIDYYIMDYRKLYFSGFNINIFDDPDFNNVIKNKTLGSDPMKNIIVKYFNLEDIRQDDIDNLKHIDYLPTKDLFYLVPMVIFILQRQLSKMMSMT